MSLDNLDDYDLSLPELVKMIENKFRNSPVSARADFMVEVAHALRLDGDESALLNRTYAQAETDWGVH